jgi:hypothetical protein
MALIRQEKECWWYTKLKKGWIELPSVDEYYAKVKACRLVGQDQSGIDLDAAECKFHPAVKACIVTDSFHNFDRKTLGQFISFYRAARTGDDWINKLKGTRLEGIDALPLSQYLDLVDADSIRILRDIFMPRKVKPLDAEQSIGKSKLDTLDQTIKEWENGIGVEIDRAARYLKALRVYRDNVRTGFINQFPGRKEIKQARRVALTPADRTAATTKHAGSEQLQYKYTLDSYLNACRMNKAEAKERELYRGFLSGSTEEQIVSKVRQTVAASGNKPLLGGVEPEPNQEDPGINDEVDPAIFGDDDED